MPIKKTKDSYKGEPGDIKGQRKTKETDQLGSSTDKRVAKAIDLERRIIAE